MVEFEGQLVDALGEYDYGKAVGRGLQVAGAATSAVGGAVSLLAQLRIKPSAGLGAWYLHIEPGYLEDRWRLEVNLRNAWRNDKPQEYRVVVDLDTDVVTQVSGVPLAALSRVDRDADGRVKWVSICVDEAKQPEDRLRQFHVARARVRLVMDGAQRRQVPKGEGTGVEMVLPSSEPVVSLDPTACKRMEEAAR